MFSAKVIFIIIIIHIIAGLLGRSGKIASLQKLFLSIDLLSTLLLIFIGLDMLIGWTDPFSGADLSENSRAMVRGGFIIMIIKYWPYCLIGWSLYSLFYFIKNGFWSFLFKK